MIGMGVYDLFGVPRLRGSDSPPDL